MNKATIPVVTFSIILVVEFCVTIYNETLADVMGIDESFFAHVFQWHRTPEGRAFWLEISDRWLELFPKIDGCPQETAQAGR